MCRVRILHAEFQNSGYSTVDPDLVPLDEVLDVADLLVIGAPHLAYAEIETDVPVVDVWNLRGHGVLV
jgi:UDP-N-acetyl-D-mannosaminuronic acid dehydrogenase